LQWYGKYLFFVCLVLNSVCTSLCQAYTCSHYICPICSKSLGDMSVRLKWFIFSVCSSMMLL
jgi:hypothetical protein